MSIGSKLRELREAAGLNKREVAENSICPTRHTTITAYEFI